MLTYLSRDDVRFESDDLERQRRVLIYAAQYEAEVKRLGIELPDPTTTGPFTKPVYCPELQCCFLTPAAAARHLDSAKRNVLNAIQFGTRVSGVHLIRLEEAPTQRVCTGRERRVRITHIDSGVDYEFDTLCECSKFMGAPGSTLCTALKRNEKGENISVRGYEVEYVVDEEFQSDETVDIVSIMASSTQMEYAEVA